MKVIMDVRVGWNEAKHVYTGNIEIRSEELCLHNILPIDAEIEENLNLTERYDESDENYWCASFERKRLEEIEEAIEKIKSYVRSKIDNYIKKNKGCKSLNKTYEMEIKID